MFKSKEKAIEDQMISTVISEGYRIEGHIKGHSVIRIDGEIKGDIQSEKGVILGEKSNITGKITSKSVIVYGTVKGNIYTESLEIKHTGVINGDIETQKLEVELGGIYNGKLSMSVHAGKAEPKNPE